MNRVAIIQTLQLINPELAADALKRMVGFRNRGTRLSGPAIAHPAEHH